MNDGNGCSYFITPSREGLMAAIKINREKRMKVKRRNSYSTLSFFSFFLFTEEAAWAEK